MWFKKKEQLGKNAPKSAESTEQKSSAKKTIKVKKAPKKKKQGISLGQIVSGILDGSFLTKKAMIQLLPFGLFLVFLAIIYIGNQYAALRRVRSIEKINTELKELRNQHISTKSELMYRSKISEVAKQLESEGITETKEPPFKIKAQEDGE